MGGDAKSATSSGVLSEAVADSGYWGLKAQKSAKLYNKCRKEGNTKNCNEGGEGQTATKEAIGVFMRKQAPQDQEFRIPCEKNISEFHFNCILITRTNMLI